MASARPSLPQGPAIRALDPWIPGNPPHGPMKQLLSPQERARLAVIASVVRFKKGDTIYRQDAPADAVYNIITGVAKAYKTAADESAHVVAFLFPEDLFGLAQEGVYENSTMALTMMTAYRIPTAALRNRLLTDASLEFHVIAKLCHELREAQRHAFLLATKRTLPKLTMFLQMLEQTQAARGESTAEIYLPMDRSDIAEYVGVSLAALSRAFRTLMDRGVLQGRDRRHVRILNREAFDQFANSSG